MHPHDLQGVDDTRTEEQRQEDIWREQERQVRETARTVQFGCSTVARDLFNSTKEDTDFWLGYASACYDLSELLMKQDVLRWAERAIGRALPREGK